MAREAVVVIALLAACAGDPGDTKATDTDATVDSGLTDTATETGDSDTGDSGTPPDTGPFDADGDGFFAAEDCDDADSATYPGAIDWCDGKDQDCDGDPIGAEMCGEWNDLLLADATAWWLDYPVTTYVTTEWVTSSGPWLAGPTEMDGYGDDTTDDAVLVTRPGVGAMPFDNGALWHVEDDYYADVLLVAGDFDGDGWEDLISAGGSPRGTVTNAVFLLSGDSSKWPGIGAPLSENALAWWIRYTPTDLFGSQVDGRADVNGDGLADIVAEAVYESDYDKGTVHLMLGRSGELPQGERADSEVTWWYNTADPDAWDDGIGTYTFVRDADGDGLDDLIANAWSTAGQHLAFASGAALATLDGADVEDVFTLGDQWGWDVRRSETRDGKEVGDFDGDGIDDLLTSISRDVGTDSQIGVGVLSGAALAGGATIDGAILTEVADSDGDNIGGWISIGHDFDGDELLDPVATCSGSTQFGPCVLPTSRMPLGGIASLEDMGPFYSVGWSTGGTATDLDQDGVPEVHALHTDWVENGSFTHAIFSLAAFTIPYDDSTKW